jgi:hypothetical protein
MALTAGPGHTGSTATLAYVRFSPETQSREILALLGRHRRGSLSFDLCRRCRRLHIWSLAGLGGMESEGLEIRMLRLARTKAPHDYRWSRSGVALRTQEFWDDLPPVLRGRPEVPCEHLDWRPGRVRDALACRQYRKLTGRSHWPDSRATHRAVCTSPASRHAAPERLGGQLDQAREEYAAAEQAAAEAARSGVRSDARMARRARKNAAARIDWLSKRLDELDD